MKVATRADVSAGHAEGRTASEEDHEGVDEPELRAGCEAEPEEDEEQGVHKGEGNAVLLVHVLSEEEERIDEGASASQVHGEGGEGVVKGGEGG